MGNCYSDLNCTAVSVDEPLDVDPDIIGKGVLAAFFVTAVASGAAIVWGYFYDALSEDYLSEADEAIVRRYKRSKFSTKVIPWVDQKWRAVNSLFSKGRNLTKHRPLPREKRAEGLTKFILTLSDQQLITGLAILIGALTNRCRVTMYEFRVVVSLAWFSSTTHLATLSVLQHYFFHNMVVRNWRIFGMVSVMILLIFSLIAQTGVAPQTTPLQCGIEKLGVAASNPLGGGWPGQNNSTTTLQFVSPAIYQTYGNAPVFLPILYICAGLVFTYYYRVTSLYHPGISRTSGSESLTQTILRFLLRRGEYRTDHNTSNQMLPVTNGLDDPKEFAALWDQMKLEFYAYEYLRCFGQRKITREDIQRFFSEAPVDERTRFLQHLRRRPPRLTPRYRIIVGTLVYDSSFISQIPGIIFDIGFGISQVASVRWVFAPLLSPISSRMDFGQIVPIFLLSLPMLVAAEIYYESRPNPKSTTARERTLIAGSTSPNQRASQDSGIAEGLELSSIAVQPTQNNTSHAPANPHPENDTFDPTEDKRMVNQVLWSFLINSVMSITTGILYNGISTSVVLGLLGPGLYVLFRVTSLLLKYLAYVALSDRKIFHEMLLQHKRNAAERDNNASPDLVNAGSQDVHTDTNPRVPTFAEPGSPQTQSLSEQNRARGSTS